MLKQRGLLPEKLMKKSMTTLTLLYICVSLCITSAHASPKLIDGLQIAPRGSPAGSRNLPYAGGNAFIIYEQYDNNCGPTSVQMVLHYYGQMKTLKEVWNAGRISNVKAGTRAEQLRNALTRLGVPATWIGQHRHPPDPFLTLKKSIDDHCPPILLLKLGRILDGGDLYHWVVVVGYDDMMDPNDPSDDEFLIADPARTDKLPILNPNNLNGRFVWYKRHELQNKWAFNLQKPVNNTPELGAFIVEPPDVIGTGPYTMIVPNNPPKPNSQLPGYWSDMDGDVYEGLRKFNLLGINVTNVTFQTKMFDPFNIYQISSHNLMTTPTSVAKLLPMQHHRIGVGNQIQFTGRFTEGENWPGRMWVVVRTYSEMLPPHISNWHPLSFSDPALQAAIAKVLKKQPNQPINRLNMQRLTNLEKRSWRKKITDLTGLKHATNLSTLRLTHGNISDLSHLAGLKNLKVLDLRHNNISDITLTHLKNLKNLKVLDLSRNNISDITHLKDLKNLIELYLDANAISDITPLKNLKNLKSLILSNNSISDVTALTGLNNLEELFINGNQIEDKTPLEKLRKKNPNIQIVE